MKVNYQKICLDLLNSLPERQRVIITRRFALGSTRSKATLQAIGKDLGITRERVRQIERSAFLKMQKDIKKYKTTFDYFKRVLKNSGNLKKEKTFLAEIAESKFQNHAFFLLSLSKSFVRFSETEDYHAFWTTNKSYWLKAQKMILNFVKQLKKDKKPVVVKDKLLISYLEISKKVLKSKKGLYGLKDWPEINPRKIKDKAYVTLMEQQKPLHFAQVASLISPSALAQTVHNELIKDPRFVLVGRGTYALKEWGYETGMVKDVIGKIIKTAGKPLSQQEILDKTLKQRLVKENTVLFNLNNRKYFLRDSDGYYSTREA